MVGLFDGDDARAGGGGSGESRSIRRDDSARLKTRARIIRRQTRKLQARFESHRRRARGNLNAPIVPRARRQIKLNHAKKFS